jgi:predicted RNA-binding protein YlxR (DUF448 family)
MTLAVASQVHDRTPDGPVQDETDATASGPRRRCLVTGEERPRAELVRFVVSPDGAIVPDIDGRLPGRGLWTLARREVVAAAAASTFARAAKRPVKVEAGLADQVEKLLLRRCVEGLGLARRAGQAVGGFERVREWLRQGKCGALVMASDASSEGRRKLGASLPISDALRSDELGTAFGGDAVSYVGLASGALAGRIMADLARLSGFRRAGPASGRT